MAKVTATTSSITIEIADPAELERLMVVLTRSKSTKIKALREEMQTALMAQLASEAVTPNVVAKMLLEIEEHLATEA